jgi:hypothetical protein
VIDALADLVDAETFPAVWRPALERLLGEQIGRPAAPAVRHLLASTRARTRDDALRILEVMGEAIDADRLAVVRSHLLDPHVSCGARRAAVRRLTVVESNEADALLSRLASERRACGSAEARDSLRRRQTTRVAEAR